MHTDSSCMRSWLEMILELCYAHGSWVIIDVHAEVVYTPLVEDGFRAVIHVASGRWFLCGWMCFLHGWWKMVLGLFYARGWWEMVFAPANT